MSWSFYATVVAQPLISALAGISDLRPKVIIGQHYQEKVRGINQRQLIESINSFQIGSTRPLLVDAANAFNSLNRQVLLHSITITCPVISTFVKNCYSNPARLFVIGGVELSSCEGTTRGDPLGMAICTRYHSAAQYHDIAIEHNKMAAFADDVSAAAKLPALRDWGNQLIRIDSMYGYLPQSTKSWLIVKPDKAMRQEHVLKELI